MKVQLLTGLAGEGFAWQPGDIVDLPEPDALRMIERGFATFPEVERETTAMDTGQTAVQPKPKRHQRG